MGGFVLLIIPGIYLTVVLAFSFLFLVDEGQRGWSALAKSWYYVRGRWWTVFGRLLSFGLLALISWFIITGIGSIFGIYEYIQVNSTFTLKPTALGTIIIAIYQWLVLAPVGLVYGFGLYRSLKLTKSEPVAEELAKYRKRSAVFAAIGLISGIILLVALGGLPLFLSGLRG